MTTLDDVARSLNTVGLATWFGGSLMGVVALPGSDGQRGGPTGDTATSVQFEDEVWRKWSPVQKAAIGAYLLGAAKLTTTNKGRVLGQKGVGKVAMVKGASTLGALGATFYAARLGRQLHDEVERSPSDGGPDGQADAGESASQSKQLRDRLRKAQVAVPLLTGVALVADSRLGEQQRPLEVLKGMAARAVPESLHLPDLLQAGSGLGAGLGAAAAGKGILPDAVRSLEDAAKHLPDAARALTSK